MANHLSFDVLSRLIERRAPPVEEAKAQRHLASCGRCRSELAWLERIHSKPWSAGSSRADFELPPPQGPPTVSRIDDETDESGRPTRGSGSVWTQHPSSWVR